MSKTARLKRQILKLRYKIELKNNTINQLTDEVYTLTQRTEMHRINFVNVINSQNKTIDNLMEHITMS
jgi:hypothetical protein